MMGAMPAQPEPSPVRDHGPYEQETGSDLVNTLTGEQVQVIIGWIIRAHLAGAGLDQHAAQGT